MKRNATLLLCFTILLGVIRVIPVSGKEIGFPLVKNYFTTNYNAHNQNWGIIQDDRGIMYFANGDGVLVYDGNAWELIQMPNKISARAIGKSSDGIIYVGGTNELGFLQPDQYGMLKYISLIDSVGISSIGIIRDILCTDSCIYFRSAEYFIRLNHKGFSSWRAKSTYSIFFLYNENLFIQDEEYGLFNLVKDSLFIAPSGKDFINKKFYFAKQYNNEVILANRIKGLYKYEPELNKEKKLKQIDSDANLTLVNDFVFSGIITKEGEIILGTNSGGCVIVNLEGKILSRITKETGIQDNNVHALFIDRDENLWLALNNGLFRCDIAEPISHWNNLQGLDGFVTSMIQHQGTFYIGTLQGLFYLHNNKIDKIQSGISQVWSFLNFKIPDSNKEILLIIALEGVFIFENNSFTKISTSSVGYTLYQSNKNPNIIYLGLLNNVGVLEYNNGKFIYKGEIQNSGISIRSIAEDENGTIWMGTYREGVVSIIPSNNLFKPKEITHYKLESGLPSLKDVLIYRLNNKMVFATENGLYKFDKSSNKFYPDSTLGNLFTGESKDIYALSEDQSGNVYVTQLVVKQGSIGVATLKKDGSYSWNSTRYNKMPRMIVNMLYLDNLNDLWIGGSEGLYKFDESVHRKYDKVFYTFIRSVKIKGDSCIFFGNHFIEKKGEKYFSTFQDESLIHEIDYRLNSIKFSYSAPEFSNESELKFQYKLEGYDDKWSDWTTSTVKEYTNLWEGTYKFRVISTNLYNIKGEESTFEFIVLPPWFRTTIAYILYLVVVILFILLIVKISIRRLKDANIYLEEQVRVRTEEILQQKEELLAQSEELLAQSEELERNNLELEKLSIVASRTDNGVTIMNPDGVIEWINLGFTRLTGFTLEEIYDQIGKSVFEVSSHKHIKQLFEQCISTKESIIYETSFETKAKETLWLQTTLTPIFDSDNLISKVVAIDSNITEIKNAHQETISMIDEIVAQAEQIQRQNDEITDKQKDLENAQKQLMHAEKMASIGVLTAGIAHEINNPVNFVYAGVNSVMRDFSDVDQVLQIIRNIENTKLDPAEIVQQILTKKNEYDFDEAYKAIGQTMNDIMYGAQRTAEIVQGLRNFSRSEKEEFSFTNINKIVEGVLILLKNKYKHHVEIVKNLDDSLPAIECKMGKMNQVIMNIISNAIDAIKEKGTIYITSRIDQDKCTISVKDDGAGISEDVLPKIFDPFFTTKEIGQGTGLGLSISYGIIEEHNGTIAVKSKPGEGTEFIVTIPVKQS